MSVDPPRAPAEAASALPAGTRLHEFEVRRLLGVGGFGIVYLAFDHALEREVAIKEYMPASLVGRTETLAVSLRSDSDAEVFALGLRSFVNEARLLARFDHPSLIKVHRFFEANGTAYMAMPVLHGRTLKQLRLAPQPGEPALDEARLRALLGPLLGALEKLHEAGVYHRDVAPDNIVVEPDGRPVLLDFGAARRVIGDRTQTLTAILKPAYAPVEQYAEAGSVKQGPWTDLYALGATLHHLLLGRPPEPATARALSDDAPPLATRSIAGCSEGFLRIVDWMLAPRPADRPQSVAELREALEGGRVAAAPPARVRAGAEVAASTAPTIALGGSSGATLVELPLATPAATRVEPSPPPLASAATGPAPFAPRRRTGLAVGAGVAIVAVGVAAFAFRPGGTTPTPPVAGAASSAAGAGPVPAVVPAGAEPGTAMAPGGPGSPGLAATTGAAPAAVAPVAPVAPVASVASVASVAAPAAGVRATAPARPSPATAATSPAPAPAPALAPATSPPTAAVPSPPMAAAPRPEPATLPAAVPAPGPEARCATRDNPIRRFACMERLCLRSEFRSHPDCLNWRREARPRE
jgi:hypothetical protein